MNREKVIWGIALFCVGLILLLSNLDLLDFHWRSVFRMWPLIIIIVGVNLLFSKSKVGKTVSVLITVLCLGWLVYVGANPAQSEKWQFSNRGKDWGGASESGNRRVTKNYLSHEFLATTEKANLEIRGGAVEYKIEKADPAQLFWSEIESVVGAHELNVNQTDSSARLLFTMKEQTRKSDWNFRNEKNEAIIRLHPAPVWNLQLNMGAGTAEFDLRSYKVAKLDMNCGAASIEVKLGEPVGHSEVTVESGAASVDIEIPANVPCKIYVKSALSGKTFKGFQKQADGSYTTPGYAEQSERYTIHLRGGVSSFSVKIDD